MSKFVISIERDYKAWQERDEIHKHFPDHRILSHETSMQTACEFLTDDIGHLSHLYTFKINQDTIILTLIDDRLINNLRTIARLCVDRMNYSGFYLFKEFTE